MSRYPSCSIPVARAAAFACVLSLATLAHAGDPPWPTASPESKGFDRAKLDAARDVLAERNTKNFLVIRQDRIVYEWYADDAGPNKPHYTASLAKALVGGIPTRDERRAYCRG